MPTSTSKNGTSQAKAPKVDEVEKAKKDEKAAATPEKHEAPRRASMAPKTEDKQPITVLFDRVMVQISQSDGERRSRAGILIPATAQITRRLAWAEAVATGPHVRTVKVGDTVLFNPEDRFEVEVHGEEFVILRERDIHAIASPRNDSGTGLYL
ncbi:MAG TPA: co-chaperone GroES [Acidimicrobiales bacterium]